MVISEQTWATICHVGKELTGLTHDVELEDSEMREGLRAVLDLATAEEERWDPPGDTARDRELWRSGYEQCMADIVEALADVWQVEVTTEEHEGRGRR
jgi:hypothetical protein